MYYAAKHITCITLADTSMLRLETLKQPRNHYGEVSMSRHNTSTIQVGDLENML